MKASWICLAIGGAGILVFGIVAVVVPASHDESLMRADGMASVGMGL